MTARRRTPRPARHKAAALALTAIAASGCTAVVAKAHAAGTERAAAHRAAPATSPAGSTPDVRSTTRAAAQPVAALGNAIPASESYPEIKREAVRAALGLTNYSRSGVTSSGTVVYPQMGGATADSAAVMVVVRQVLRTAAGTRAETRTLDVRLVRAGGTWRFDRLASDGGTPLPRPASLSAAARAVLDDPRIALPDSARWDIYRGAVAPALLSLMEQIAARGPYAVTVLETGHPHDVFGTSHASAHASGHAIDIRRFAGRDVVDSHAIGSPSYDLVQWLLGLPQVHQVGSPWNLDGAGSRSFTNEVHADHVHVAL